MTGRHLLLFAMLGLFVLACGSNNSGTNNTQSGDATNPKQDGLQSVFETVVPTFDVTNAQPDTRLPFPDTTTIPIPDTNTSVPDTNTTVPDTNTSVPDTNTTVPDTTVPDTNTSVPDTAMPDTNTSVPDTSSADTGNTTPTGIPALGGGTHSPSSVTIEVLADKSNTTLNTPRDLAFNPKYANELWVVNYESESMTILLDVTNPAAQRIHRSDPTGHHFLARPSSLAFGALGWLATIHETDIKTQATTAGDFMGPTLYSESLQTFDGGHGGHYDMLHNTPNGMGIAWEAHNIYWVFDGYHSSITRYNFAADHGPGGSYHGDGIVRRYVEGQVKRVPLVPSHMYLAPGTNNLYIADSGNNRIAVLDISSGTLGGTISPNYDAGSKQNYVNNAKLTTLIKGDSFQMKRPSGLEIHNGVLYVTDNLTSVIYAFDLSGKLLDYLQIHETIPAGSMMGIALDKSDRIYLVDSKGNRIIRLSAK